MPPSGSNGPFPLRQDTTCPVSTNREWPPRMKSVLECDVSVQFLDVWQLPALVYGCLLWSVQTEPRKPWLSGWSLMSVRFVCGWRGRANVNVYRAIGILPQILAGQLIDGEDVARGEPAIADEEPGSRGRGPPREWKALTNRPRKCRSDTIMARIVAEKSESSFLQVIHSAGV